METNVYNVNRISLNKYFFLFISDLNLTNNSFRQGKTIIIMNFLFYTVNVNKMRQIIFKQKKWIKVNSFRYHYYSIEKKNQTPT